MWSRVAAWKLGIKNFRSFSAGSEVSAVHPNTRDALIRAGVSTIASTIGQNPIYQAEFGGSFPSLVLFSKGIDSSELPAENFGAVLVCVKDAEACPFIPHAEVRIPLTYDDPKNFDGTEQMPDAYDRCCKQIASEMFWLMNEVQKKR